MRVLTNHVALEITKTPMKTAGGLYIPHQKLKQEGIVRYVGPDVKGLVPDDRVVFPKHSGQEIMDGDVRLVLFKEEEILCLIKM